MRIRSVPFALGLAGILPARAIFAALACCAGMAQASVGLAEIAAHGSDGPVTVYYPSNDPERPLERGRRGIALRLAEGGAPVPGNGRLVVISHGSGGSPWVHADLARRLVEAGFVVAMPEHRGDNYKDDSDPGPDSWTIRPGEVSRAIDAVARDPRFAPHLILDKVGMFGTSAGGHTALSLAGGRWSPALFKKHCEQDLVQDFPFCVGLATHLTGGVLDGLKEWVALAVIRRRFSDETLRSDTDARIAAIVAAVPAAADFDMTSLAEPRVPLALVTAQQDRWLAPRFHGERLLEACKPCVRLVNLPGGGHGALLSPFPPGLGGIAGELLNDPPGFDRAAATEEVDRKVTAFFVAHLLPSAAGTTDRLGSRERTL